SSDPGGAHRPGQPRGRWPGRSDGRSRSPPPGRPDRARAGSDGQGYCPAAPVRRASGARQPRPPVSQSPWPLPPPREWLPNDRPAISPVTSRAGNDPSRPTTNHSRPVKDSSGRPVGAVEVVEAVRLDSQCPVQPRPVVLPSTDRRDFNDLGRVEVLL